MFLLHQQREVDKRDPRVGFIRKQGNLQEMSFKSVLQSYDSCSTLSWDQIQNASLLTFCSYNKKKDKTEFEKQDN